MHHRPGLIIQSVFIAVLASQHSSLTASTALIQALNNDARARVAADLSAAQQSGWQHQTVVGTVVSVSDGDTLTVMDSQRRQHKIRLAGIDAPEYLQAYGRKARFSLSDLVYLKEVRVEAHKLDAYERLVGVVYVNQQDINLTQVERGMAWWNRLYLQEQSAADQALYRAAEQQTRQKRLGLWGEAQPTPPWVYRRQQPAQKP